MRRAGRSGSAPMSAVPRSSPAARPSRPPTRSAHMPCKKAEPSDRADATSYDSQPAALREVLERSFPEIAFSWFGALSDDQRASLVYIYNRMVKDGIWQHVRFIRGVKD